MDNETSKNDAGRDRKEATDCAAIENYEIRDRNTKRVFSAQDYYKIKNEEKGEKGRRRKLYDNLAVLARIYNSTLSLILNLKCSKAVGQLWAERSPTTLENS